MSFIIKHYTNLCLYHYCTIPLAESVVTGILISSDFDRLFWIVASQSQCKGLRSLISAVRHWQWMKSDSPVDVRKGKQNLQHSGSRGNLLTQTYIMENDCYASVLQCSSVIIYYSCGYFWEFLRSPTAMMPAQISTKYVKRCDSTQWCAFSVLHTKIKNSDLLLPSTAII